MVPGERFVSTANHKPLQPLSLSDYRLEEREPASDQDEPVYQKVQTGLNRFLVC
jgi:hypothetical protein